MVHRSILQSVAPIADDRRRRRYGGLGIGIASGRPSPRRRGRIAGRGTSRCARARFVPSRRTSSERRRDHLLVRHVLAGHRPVENSVGLAVQIPFARRVEPVGRVLDVVARVGFFVGRPWIARSAWRCATPRPRSRWACGCRPRRAGDHFDIARLGPLPPDVAAAEVQAERLILRARAIDAVEAVVGRAGALSAASADEQLPERKSRRSRPSKADRGLSSTPR